MKFLGLKLFVPLLLLLLPSACVTFSDMEQGLEQLKGKHIDHAIAKLGYPDGERVAVGRKIYIWAKQRTQNYTVPQTSSTVGHVGGTRVDQRTTTYQTETVTHHCRIELVVDDAGIVIAWSIDGDLSGCQVYGKRLQQKSA